MVISVPGADSAPRSNVPYTPLELEGRDVFISEGCYTCHSQMIRPFTWESARYPASVSTIDDSIFDHPFQWGSRRIGPDLARVGGKYADVWHYKHMINPREISIGFQHATLSASRDVRPSTSPKHRRRSFERMRERSAFRTKRPSRFRRQSRPRTLRQAAIASRLGRRKPESTFAKNRRRKVANSIVNSRLVALISVSSAPRPHSHGRIGRGQRRRYGPAGLGGGDFGQ